MCALTKLGTTRTIMHHFILGQEETWLLTVQRRYFYLRFVCFLLYDKQKKKWLILVGMLCKSSIIKTVRISLRRRCFPSRCDTVPDCVIFFFFSIFAELSAARWCRCFASVLSYPNDCKFHPVLVAMFSPVKSSYFRVSPAIVNRELGKTKMR